MIKISDSARDRLLQIMSKEEDEKKYVRVGVESGGCSGLSYKLDFDLQKLEDDELIKDNKIQLLVNKKSKTKIILRINPSRLQCLIKFVFKKWYP